MIRILLIEALLFGLLGAIVFRLLFAFIRRMAVVQAISVLPIMVITIFIGARVDPQPLHEWGGSVRDDLPAIVLRAVRTAA
ncbi:MAG: hypothetical protein ACYCOY_11245 [Metallibacterium sp.]